MERRALVVQRLARASHALLASAQGAEVLCRLGHIVTVQALPCEGNSQTMMTDPETKQDDQNAEKNKRDVP